MIADRIRSIAAKISGFRRSSIDGRIQTDFNDPYDSLSGSDHIIDHQMRQYTKSVLLEAVKTLRQEARELGFRDAKAAGVLHAMRVLKKEANKVQVRMF
jgi:hypothetical protein